MSGDGDSTSSGTRSRLSKIPSSRAASSAISQDAQSSRSGLASGRAATGVGGGDGTAASPFTPVSRIQLTPSPPPQESRPSILHQYSQRVSEGQRPDGSGSQGGTGAAAQTPELSKYGSASRSHLQLDRELSATPPLPSRPPLSTAASPSQGGGGAANILVAVRMRPLSDKERSRGDHAVWHIDSNKNIGQHGKDGSWVPKYRYDNVFGPQATNREVFDTVARPLIAPTLQGFSGTVFAYGVTSSGKTHTVMGGEASNGYEPGLLPLAIQQLFSLISEQQQQQQGGEQGAAGGKRTYTVKLSMMEIYNEVLNDLLDPSRTNLKLREDPGGRGTVVDGLHEEVVASADQALALIRQGEAYRKVSSTAYNEDSSRSHTVCRLVVEGRPEESTAASGVNSGRNSGRVTPSGIRTGSGSATPTAGPSPAGGKRLTTTHAVLSLIDLAGSESAKVSVSKGQRMEGSYINKSLLTLGTVINKLAAVSGSSAGSRQHHHIPFRDSKLTRLLQNSMTGAGARIAIVCAITPAAAQAEETANTLKFATRAKLVRIAVSASEGLDERALLRRYRLELSELRAQLAAMMAAQQAWHLPHSPSAAHAAALDAPWSGGGAGGGGDSCQGDEPDLLSSFFKPGIELIADEGSGQTVSAGGAGAGMSAGGAAVHGAGSGARVVALEAEVATLRARLESEHALRLRLQQENDQLEMRLHGMTRLLASGGHGQQHQGARVSTSGALSGPSPAGVRTHRRGSASGGGGVGGAGPHHHSHAAPPHAEEGLQLQGSASGISAGKANSVASVSPTSSTLLSDYEFLMQGNAVAPDGGSGTAAGDASRPQPGSAARKPPHSSRSNLSAGLGAQGRALSGYSDSEGAGDAEAEAALLAQIDDLHGELLGDVADMDITDHMGLVKLTSTPGAAGSTSQGPGSLQGKATPMGHQQQNGQAGLQPHIPTSPAVLLLPSEHHSIQHHHSNSSPPFSPAAGDGVHTSQQGQQQHLLSHGEGLPPRRGTSGLPPAWGSSSAAGTATGGPGSVRSGGASVAGDLDKDLEIQVLLADREVLQDQVVAVELANERLAAENGALAAEAARLKLEHEKERRIVRELESDMAELRRFRNETQNELEALRREAVAWRRQQQQKQQQSAGGPGAPSDTAQVTPPSAAAVIQASGLGELRARVATEGPALPQAELAARLEALEAHVLAAVGSVVARNRQLEDMVRRMSATAAGATPGGGAVPTHPSSPVLATSYSSQSLAAAAGPGQQNGLRPTSRLPPPPSS